MALFVIGVAGFGRRIFWKEDELVPPGHKVTFKVAYLFLQMREKITHHTFQGALHTVAKEVFTKLVVPDWVLKLGLTESHRQTTLAFDELHMYLVEMIRARKESEKKEERYDLFSSLLDANEEEEDGQVKLQDSELIGMYYDDSDA
ncbi:hypothetical protein PHLCEN_2v8344 [Hermanssonia centrifuga]|uniref:Uncharacterized protein n=1 Tax=Hermanssonia centrifuga TaxID=98765 RepID=A0A2R6NTV4_9APHY|nr:hypothetical protein PHLCEN_2v8344 [Hermanssonia centrifuga]